MKVPAFTVPVGSPETRMSEVGSKGQLDKYQTRDFENQGAKLKSVFTFTLIFSVKVKTLLSFDPAEHMQCPTYSDPPPHLTPPPKPCYPSTGITQHQVALYLVYQS